MHPQIADFVTILLLVALEGLLSADNAMVLAVLVLGLPRPQQRRALRVGIGGAFLFRTLATFAAIYLIKLNVVKLVGALYLLYLPAKYFHGREAGEARRAAPAARSWLGLPPFWATVVRIELTDIVFAFDSILVAVAMSPKIWVVLSGGLLGIVMMRIVITRLLSLIERYPALVDGAFVIIGWVGLKLLLDYLHTRGTIGVAVPQWLSLSLVGAIFGGALVYARREEARRIAREAELGARRDGTEGDGS
ncbi:MAG TPA: hypothetical protein VNE16_12470 [Vicinamibacterales bacterium]|nr:hypothetical protein [Vicinamibacterales bacterium]